MKIVIHGHSDDIIYVYGIQGKAKEGVMSSFGATEDHEAGSEIYPKDSPGSYVGTLIFTHGEEKLYVHCYYNGVWWFAPAINEEETPFPDWPVTVKGRKGCPYSSELTIEAPERTKMNFEFNADA